jgi:uncharacterized protein (UPF0276 family)
VTYHVVIAFDRDAEGDLKPGEALEVLSPIVAERRARELALEHAGQTDDEGDRLIIDSHDGPVADAVWKLYEIVIAKAGPLPTLVEWDSNIPEWLVLEAEAAAAQAILDRYAAPIILERSDAA